MCCLYAILKRRKTPGIEDAPSVMAYLYAGHVIPAAVNEKLQNHIQGLISSLEAGQPLFDWVFVPEATAKEVVHVLKQWQGPLEAPYLQAKTVRKAVGDRLALNRARRRAVFGQDVGSTPPNLKEDSKVFDDLTVLLPDEGFASRRDPTLVPLMKK